MRFYGGMMEADLWIKKLKSEYGACGGCGWAEEKKCVPTDIDYSLKMRAVSGDEDARRELLLIADRYGLRESAGRGEADAELEFGKLCLVFLGKREEGKEWIKRAAEHGKTEAELLLGEILCGKCEYLVGEDTEKDLLSAYELFMNAAKTSGKANLYLGQMYRDGCDAAGVEKNERKAFDYFRQAASKGRGLSRAKAMAEIARFCKNDTVFKDCETAFKLYSALAKVGLREASCELADCYLKGIGVSKDAKKASEILFAAALSGNADAEKMYDELKTTDNCPQNG